MNTPSKILAIVCVIAIVLAFCWPRNNSAVYVPNIDAETPAAGEVRRQLDQPAGELPDMEK